MKKVLLTTSALAFAGSAFAADVSGYVISAYKKADSKKSLYNETEVYFSGSKTASNGLTFGATYTIGFSGSEASVQGKASKTEYTAPAAKGYVTSVTETAGSSSQFANVNAFVSGSFGKVAMGKHATATRAIGGTSLAVGTGIDGSVTAVVTRENTTKGVTYTSPKFNGVQAAYTKELEENGAKAWAINWSGKASGVGVAVAYGKHTAAGAGKVADTAWGVKVSKGAFAASYVRGKEGANSNNKSTQIGVAYTAGKVSVGYSQEKVKGTAEQKNSVIQASYAVASGLKVFAERQKSGDTKTTLIGTNISF
ncbi:MAG: porin [Alphaproteobacteria bacterium]